MSKKRMHDSTRSLAKILVGLIIATTWSFNASAEESKRQQRLAQDISREAPDRGDHPPYRGDKVRKHLPTQQQERQTKRDRKRPDGKKNHRQPKGEVRERNPAVTRFKSGADVDPLPSAAQIKKKVNKQQRQINQLQRKTKQQQKQINHHRSFAANNKRQHRNHQRRHRENLNRQHERHGANKRWKKRRNAEHRRFYHAQYGKSHRSNRYGHNYWHKQYRTFGRGYYPSTGFIYSYRPDSQTYAHQRPRGFVWDSIETFHTPSKKHGYNGAEIVIDINERVRTMQLEGRKRRMLIEAAYVELGNGTVRRLPEFEGLLYDNHEVKFHFRDSRYVVAVYLDVASNEGRKGKASLSVLRNRYRH